MPPLLNVFLISEIQANPQDFNPWVLSQGVNMWGCGKSVVGILVSSPKTKKKKKEQEEEEVSWQHPMHTKQ